jgi:DNA-binding FrmR family transcriptional regulator
MSKPKEHVHESHPDIVKRLKRAEGHIKGVIAMFAEGRSCLDLAQQLHAVSSFTTTSITASMWRLTEGANRPAPW